jgi:L-alanine-DL-glutamate epimerase-like enolase superfamily enzyme
MDVLAQACSETLKSESTESLMEMEECLGINVETVRDDINLRYASRGSWTAEEDEKLRKAVAEFGGRNWKKIAEQITDRTDVQCLHRWQKVLRPGLVKGPWTPEVSSLRPFFLSSFMISFSLL